MDIKDLTKQSRSEVLLTSLLRLWRASVEATHLFLTPGDVARIEPWARCAMEQIDVLSVAFEGGEPIAFIGTENGKVEMLFVSPAHFGQGIGRRLMERAIERGAHWVDVNEQNPQAAGFYRHLGFEVFRRDALDDAGDPFPILRMRLAKQSDFRGETARLLLRPWQESDAGSLYKYASDPAVGPVAGWRPHASVEESREIIRTVFAAPEVYAVVLKETGEPVGCVGLLMDEERHSAEMRSREAEIGYWIGRPYWGRGLMAEAVRCLLRRGFETLGLASVWGGHYEGNGRSRRVMEKCGFRFHHTEKGKVSPLGDVRTEHFLRLTAGEWRAANSNP